MSELKEQIKSLLCKALNEKDEDKKEVENEDKRKIIDEVGGILKDKVDEEVWRTVIGKLEKLSYEPSEDDKADNCGRKAKNEDEKEEKEEKFKEEKEIAENKKAKNEEEKEDEDREEDREEKAENKCKNSMDDVRKAVFGGKSEIKSEYIPHSKRIELGNNY